MTTLLAASLSAHPLSAQEPPAGPWVGVAQSFVQHLNAGKHEQAAAMIAPGPAKEALPSAQLERIWAQVKGAAGELVSLTPAGMTEQDTLRVVDLAAGFERQHFLIRVVVTPQEQVTGLWFLPPEPPPYTPPAYVDTAAFEEFEVTIGADPWRLPGTLSVPRTAGRLPAIVLVGGSGPIDRDGTLGPNRAYRDLAWGLASRGIAVLRYDKRTRAHGARMATTPLTVDDEVIEDALAAIALMRAHERIDGRRIVLVGHSLGGMLAPQIAERAGRLAGVIMMATPARPLADVMAEQLDYIVTLTPGAATDPQHPVRAVRDTVELLRQQKLAPDRVVLGASVSYMYDLARRDLVAMATRVTAPILVLQGGRDYQATMEDFELWRRVFAGRTSVTLRDFPNLNHMFFPGEGKAVPEEYLTPASLAEPVVKAIEEWIRSI